MRVAFIYPQNLAAEKATPIRARVTIEAVRQSVQAHVLAWDGDPAWVETFAKPIESNPAGGESTPRPRFRRWSFAQEVSKHLETLKPQVIHAFLADAVPAAVFYKHRHPEVRLVFEMHALTCLQLRGIRLRPRLGALLLDYWGARWADAIVAMSYTQRELLRRWLRIGPEKTHVLWGPVDLDLFYRADPPPVPPFVVGYAGNDAFYQGVEAILEAARHLKHREDIHFRLMGFPKERYNRLELGNVELLGVLPRTEVPRQLNRCHVLLSTRIRGRVADSQYPFKLSAYLAVGRPVIASTVSDQPLILEQADCGQLVPPEDPRALAEAIVRLREMPEGRRSEMGHNARRFAERHLSLDSLAEALLAIYGNAANYSHTSLQTG